jgi:hypothetical protein
LIVLEGLGAFCTGFGNLAQQSSETFCNDIPFPEPSSVEITITVVGEGSEQFTLSNTVEIENTGAAVQNDIGPYVTPGACVISTISPYTCAPSTTPTSTATAAATPTAGGVCNAVPTIVDGSFEDGEQALSNFYFPGGGLFNVVCGGANGLGAACGNCFG